MINNILISQNKKVGLFTSPFIEYFNERICINNVPISDDELNRLTARVKKAVDDLEKDNIFCTVFDVICAVGFMYFAEQKCDVVVLEVGLGGRFDATNIITSPLCTVICAIGYDHMQYLGDTLDKIAFEKCGTIKSNCPVVSYPMQEMEVREVIEDICVQKDALLSVPDVSELEILQCDIHGSVFVYCGVEYHISLVGEYQIYNALCAIEAARICAIPDEDIKTGLKLSKWKCRFEVFKKTGKTIVLDGAHNSHGISAFLDSAEKFFADKKVCYIFGILNEKDIDKSCDLISGAHGDIIVTSVPSERCTDPMSVYNIIAENCSDAKYIGDNIQAINSALASDCDVVCVLGSLYMVGGVRKYVEMFSQNDKTI